MNQQIYLITTDTAVKIGISSNPEKRLAAMRTHNSTPCTLLAVMNPILNYSARDIEQAFHHELQEHRLSGEWFDRACIDSLLDRYSFDYIYESANDIFWLGDIDPEIPGSMDAIEYVAHFSKAELFLLLVVKNSIQKNNRISIILKNFTKQEQVKISTGIREWISKGLMKRIRRQEYLVNPWFIPPVKKLQQQTIDYWEQLP